MEKWASFGKCRLTVAAMQTFYCSSTSLKKEKRRKNTRKTEPFVKKLHCIVPEAASNSSEDPK